MSSGPLSVRRGRLPAYSGARRRRAVRGRPRTSGASSTVSATWTTGGPLTASSRSGRRCTRARSPASTRRSSPTGCSSCSSATSSGACWPSTAAIRCRARSAATAWRCTGTTPARSGRSPSRTIAGLGHRDAVFADEMAVAAELRQGLRQDGLRAALLRRHHPGGGGARHRLAVSTEDLNVLSERIQASLRLRVRARPVTTDDPTPLRRRSRAAGRRSRASPPSGRRSPSTGARRAPAS